FRVAIAVAPENPGGLGELLRKLQVAFETPRGECSHVALVVVEESDRDIAPLHIVDSRYQVIERRQVVQRGNAALEVQALTQPEHVQPADFKRSARAESGLPLRIVQAVLAASDFGDFGAQAYRHRVAVSLPQ